MGKSFSDKLKELDGYFSREKPEIPKIWQEITDVWNEFTEGNTKFTEWEGEEDLEGLMTGLGPENLKEVLFTLKGMELWEHLPVEVSTVLLTAFISGIRTGNMLAKNRAGVARRSK